MEEERKEEETEQFICSLKQRCAPHQHAKLSKGKRERLDQGRISNSPKHPERLAHNPTKSCPSFPKKKKKRKNFPSHWRETSVTSGAFIPCHTKQVYVNKMLNVSWGTTAESRCWVWDLLGGSPTTEVQALITFPAWIQLSVLADFASQSAQSGNFLERFSFRQRGAFRGTSIWRTRRHRNTWCICSGPICGGLCVKYWVIWEILGTL